MKFYHEVRSPEKELEEDISEQEDHSISNPFGTTWEASQSRISEDIPNTIWESSEEEDDEGDFVDQFKNKIINIKQEPYYFFVAISVLVIIVLVFITINI